MGSTSFPQVGLTAGSDREIKGGTGLDLHQPRTALIPLDLRLEAPCFTSSRALI